MPERTIKYYAKQIAGEFYEGVRSGRFRDKAENAVARRLFKDERTGQIVERLVVVPFREAYPTAQHYINGHWPYFYDLARKRMLHMLGLPSVHKNTKDAIFASLREDREKQVSEQRKGKDIPDLIGQVSTNHLKGERV